MVICGHQRGDPSRLFRCRDRTGSLLPMTDEQQTLICPCVKGYKQTGQFLADWVPFGGLLLRKVRRMPMKWKNLCAWLGAIAVCGCGDDDDSNKGGGQGSGNVLEIQGAGEECVACMEAKCGTEVLACNKNRACVDLVTCTINCHNDQEHCSTRCSEESSCDDDESDECSHRNECRLECSSISSQCPTDCIRDHSGGSDKGLQLRICGSSNCLSECSSE